MKRVKGQILSIIVQLRPDSFPKDPTVIGVYTGKFHLSIVTGVQNFYNLNHLQRIVKTAKERDTETSTSDGKYGKA